jgi:phospholipid transport system substrate-binding protein
MSYKETGMRMKTVLGALALVLCLATQAQAGGGDVAQETLKTAIDKIIVLLRDPGLKAPAKFHEQREKLKTVIATVFDYKELSARTMGVNWKKFSPAQQDAFSRAFADLLAAQYLDRIQSYSNEEVLYTGRRESSAGNVEISTKIVKNGKDIAIAYRLTQLDGWKIYDIVVEGVSLVQNYRVQFQEIMVKGSPDELIAQVKKKAQDADKPSKPGQTS